MLILAYYKSARYQMKSATYIFPLSIFFILLSCNLFGQLDSTNHKKPGLHKNIFYGSFGTIGVYGILEGGIQRMLFKNPNVNYNTYWLRLATGRYYSLFSYSDGGPYFLITLGTLISATKSHFECHMGATVIYNKNKFEDAYGEYESEYDQSNMDLSTSPPKKSDFYYFWPAGSIGYRYQKPGGYFVFRTGIGFPEIFYLSLGVAF